jgi:hypothetical protein
MQQEYELKILELERKIQDAQIHIDQIKREQAQDLSEIEFFLREIKEVKQRASNNIVNSLMQC